MTGRFYTIFHTPLGWMRPVSDGTSLIRLDWQQSRWDDEYDAQKLLDQKLIDAQKRMDQEPMDAQKLLDQKRLDQELIDAQERIDQEPIDAQEPIDDISREAKQQILDYLAGTRTGFDLPLAPEGKSKSGCDWLNIMAQIPYGTTVSYKQFAAMAGKPNAPRAAGSACARNPIPIIYPCHRVVKSDGSLGNYGGGDYGGGDYGAGNMNNPKDPKNLARKDWLIRLEQGRC